MKTQAETALLVDDAVSIAPQALAPVETRAIPNPPGGGSWIWDPVEFKWNSNDPVAQPAATQE